MTPNASDSTPTIALAAEERQPCEVWTRVMGYHRPISSFNRGKQGEVLERVYFELDRCDVAGHAD
jgi:hypothetical protein